MKTLLLALLFSTSALANHGYELRLTGADGNIEMVTILDSFEECRRARQEILRALAVLSDVTYYVTCSPEA